MSMFENEHIETGIEEALKDAMPASDSFSESDEADQQSPTGVDKVNQSGSSNPALDFLNDFFGRDKRHLVAIKKGNGKNEIKAQHFDADDRAGSKRSSPTTAALDLISILRRTPSGAPFTRRPARTTSSKRVIFG